MKKRRYEVFPRGSRCGIFPLICLAVLFLGTFVLVGSINAAEVTLAWDKNLAPDLKGYKLHYGTSSKNYQYTVNVINATSCVISGLKTGVPYYFAATAYNDKGIESNYSNEIRYVPSSTPTDSADNGEMLPSNDFKYSDWAFGYHRNGDYASGSVVGEALKVRLGGVDDSNVMDGISGGWTGTFDIETSGYVTLSFVYRIITNRYDMDECNEAWVTVDGDFVGQNGEDFIDQICGIGDSGWREVTEEVYLSRGTHKLTIGGFNNKKTGPNETAEIQFEDIEIIK